MSDSKLKTGKMAGPVPTNLITGFLGVGKTTAIRHLLSQKPEGELWAVLVNEFGPVGLDDAFLSEPFDTGAPAKARDLGVAVRMIPGGCICCNASLTLSVAIKDILTRIRPDRLLIEPTGLGHPAGVLDSLRSFETAGVISRQAVICLVDPGRLSDDRVRRSPVFIDQIQLADILVATKTDIRTASDIQAFDALAQSAFPPKSAVLRSAHGALPLWVLDADKGVQRLALFPAAHAQSGADHQHGPQDEIRREPTPGQPVRLTGFSDEAAACGWIFHSADMFDEKHAADLLADPVSLACPELQTAERLKAIVRTGRGARHIERTGREAMNVPVAFRGQSRVEIIFPRSAFTGHQGAEAAFDLIESKLVSCLLA